MRVAIIERKRFGGTCVNTGCIPTKTMVASARAAYMARRGADFGVMIGGGIKVDMKRVKARKDEIVRGSTAGVENWLKSTENVTVYEGHGRFEGPRSVRVGDELLEADKVFINVGGRAAVPPIPGIESVKYLTNTGMMEVDFLPGHLLVLGGSYIGLEFGQMYRRFGSEVTIVQRGPRLIAREDEDVSAAVREILEGEGVTVCTDTGDQRIESRNGGISIKMKCGGAPREVVEPTCSWRRAGSPTRTTWVSTRPGSRWTRGATSGWTTSSRRTCRGCGPWGTSTERGRSPTPHTTTSRSSRRTCSMVTRDG